MAEQNEQNVKTGVYTYNDVEEDFMFFSSLPAFQKAVLVGTVSDVLVGDNYLYVLKDLVYDFCIIDTFSDIDLTGLYDEDGSLNINNVDKFINETGVAEIIKANVDDGVLEEIDRALELNLEYRTGIHSNPIADALSSLLNTIEKKFSGLEVDGMMDMAKAFSGVTGELTPEKMLDAYAKSDVFKNMHKDVTEKQEKRDAAMDAVAKNVIKGGKNAASSPLLSPIT